MEGKKGVRKGGNRGKGHGEGREGREGREGGKGEGEGRKGGREAEEREGGRKVRREGRRGHNRLHIATVNHLRNSSSTINHTSE